MLKEPTCTNLGQGSRRLLRSRFFPVVSSNHFDGVDVPSLRSVTPSNSENSPDSAALIHSGLQLDTSALEPNIDEEEGEDIPEYILEYLKHELVVRRVEDRNSWKTVSLKLHKDRTVPMPFRLLAVRPQLVQDSMSIYPEWVLIATMLLNKTCYKVALPAFYALKRRWPSMETLSKANESELLELMRPLGLYNTRTKRLISFAESWLKYPPIPGILYRSRVAVPPGSPKYPPTAISHLPGMGRYALDSYRIFCAKEWDVVQPKDKELCLHLRWMWAAIERKIWDCHLGVIGPATEEYLNALCEGTLDPLCTATEWLRE